MISSRNPQRAVDVIVKPFLMIFEQSWELKRVLADWKLVNFVPVSKKNPELQACLTSVPGKVMEKVLLGGVEEHLKDNTVIDHSQHSFMSGNSCLSNLISFYDKVTHPADQGKPVDVIPLDFSKAFDTVCHRILLDQMSRTQVDELFM
ncbi:hypothetical protein DUI87_12922 [Hirundo rustica rustica]|uniref:Uncharacterized protein n=1 Tax=Hirundo rustica rustica TaxID=333673 RepID=A0A3M0KFY6_HIRRU|nr:hypothetical protein DUI87_12922 [Hirundo rustica rustica]